MADTKWTKTDLLNKRVIDKMVENGELYQGLEENNVPITLNDLIDFCKKENIRFDTPILLETVDGYYPLACYHNAIAHDDNDKEYKLYCLAITDGEW